MQHFDGVGCDCTCSNLHSIFYRSLSVNFYRCFISHDKEVEDLLLEKKIVVITYAAPRKSCLPGSHHSIFAIKIFKFRQLLQKHLSWRLYFSFLGAAVSFCGTTFDHRGDALYLT